MNQPQPDPTPRGPAYQGRLLPRPDEEVVDQGLRFDMETLLGRRRMLKALGLGAGVVALAACGAGTSTSGSASTTSSTTTSSSGLTEIPEETNGPYPADGSNGPDILEQSGVVRQDIRSSFGGATGVAQGVPLTFGFTLLDMANDGAPMVGAAVYAWHCDRDGLYSMYSEGITEENYLRGVQISDDEGKVSFTSIFPACYSGRWPHIHFEVYPDQASITDHDSCIATSQMALPEDVVNAVYATSGYEQSVRNLAQISLADDNVFGEDDGVHQIGTVTGDVTNGYTALLTVPIDTGTEPGVSGGGGGDGAPGGAPGGGEGGGPGGGGEPPSGGPGGTASS